MISNMVRMGQGRRMSEVMNSNCIYREKKYCIILRYLHVSGKWNITNFFDLRLKSSPTSHFTFDQELRQ